MAEKKVYTSAGERCYSILNFWYHLPAPFGFAAWISDPASPSGWRQATAGGPGVDSNGR